MTQNKKAPRVSYSLEPEYHELFKEVAAKARRNMTDELRMMIDARAQALGLEPLNEVDPKSFAPIWETASNPA